MAEYVYKASDGAVLSVVMRMADEHPTKICVDKQGRWCKVFGEGEGERAVEDIGFDGKDVKVYERVFCEGIQVSPIAQYPYASLRLAGQISEEHAEHKDIVVRGVPQEHIPIITSKAHEREIMARYGYDRE